MRIVLFILALICASPLLIAAENAYGLWGFIGFILQAGVFVLYGAWVGYAEASCDERNYTDF